jgi:hypothetical protein
VPAQGAWIDHSCIEKDEGGTVESGHIACGITLASPDSGRLISTTSTYNCSNWTVDTGFAAGAVIDLANDATATCTVARPLACCNTPYRERFRGITTATTTGNGGGRAAMHERCAKQFAGSHLCHLAEYARASPTATPPAAGAWIDDSSYNSAFEDSGAMPRSGRSTSPTGGCAAWTAGSLAGGATTIAPAGDVHATCDTVHPLACCGG